MIRSNKYSCHQIYTTFAEWYLAKHSNLYLKFLRYLKKNITYSNHGFYEISNISSIDVYFPTELKPNT